MYTNATNEVELFRLYFAHYIELCEERILIQEGHKASFGPIASR